MPSTSIRKSKVFASILPSKKFIQLILPLAALILCCPAGTPSEPIAVPGWRLLASPEYLWPADGAIYYSFTTGGSTKVHLVVINIGSGNWKVRPAINTVNIPTSSCAEKSSSSAAINGGYFNLSDGLSASYVVIDGKQVTDPASNQALVDNPKLKPFLPAILNRSELRVLADRAGALTLQIAAHNDPIPAALTLVHSLQAGPRLLPNLTSKQEAFVRKGFDGKDVDGISSMKPAARTAIGITPDGYFMLLCAASTKQDPESHGLTLSELAELLKSLGCSEALNLDGGTSTTMFIRTATPREHRQSQMPIGHTVCGRTPETHVKSVLLLQKAKVPDPN